MSELELVRRVVSRLKKAAYFEIGTIVLYGKYKNKKGIVRSFGADKWGNPTIEIEPIPKGRKSNKVFGLFKIWKAEVKEKALEEQAKELGTPAKDPVTARVVARCIGVTDDSEGE